MGNFVVAVKLLLVVAKWTVITDMITRNCKMGMSYSIIDGLVIIITA